METICGVKIHPLASVFPLLEGEEREQLVSRFRDEGYIEDLGSIVFDQDGKCIDGRNRLSVCEELGIEYSFTTRHFDSDADRMEFIVAANIERRQLTASQRAMLAADMANIVHGSNQHREKVDAPHGASTSSEDAAKAFGVSARSVVRAKTVKNKCTKKVKDAVTDGTVSVNKAAEEFSSLTPEEQDKKVEEMLTERLSPKQKKKPGRKPMSSTTISPFKQDVARLLVKGKMTQSAFWREVKMLECSSGTKNSEKNKNFFKAIVEEVPSLELIEYESGHFELKSSENKTVLKEVYDRLKILHRAVKSDFRFDPTDVRIQSRKVIELLTPYSR